MPTLTTLLLLSCSTAVGGPSPGSQAPEGFWEHWGDGLAELNGYRLVQPRYGELRQGEAVLIFVTETFTLGDRVKSDGGHRDEFPVIKLNETRDFPTGVYDYNVMTSSFLPLDSSTPWGQPTKLSFSSQEWCGHMYDQLLVSDRRYERSVHSYFDGEADQQLKERVPEHALFADALPLLVRGLVGDIPTGQSFQLHPRLMDLRFKHIEASWTDATLTVGEAPVAVTVPMGEFQARVVELRADGQLSMSWWIEAAPPHRLLRWEGVDGELGELLGSTRAPYWSQNKVGQEGLRQTLGLDGPAR